MSAPGWTPKPGDLVVVARFSPALDDHWLEGRVVRYVHSRSDEWWPRPHEVALTGSSRAHKWAHKLRPLTSEEQAAYWLEHGGEP